MLACYYKAMSNATYKKKKKKKKIDNIYDTSWCGKFVVVLLSSKSLEKLVNYEHKLV